MEGLADSLQFLCDAVKESKEITKEIKREYSEIKKENEKLHVVTNTFLRAISELQNKVETLEQYSIKTRIDRNITPSTPNNLIQDIIHDGGKMPEMEVVNSNVNATHCIPSSKKDEVPANVEIHYRNIRKEWINKLRDYKKKNNSLYASEVNPALKKKKMKWAGKFVRFHVFALT